MGSAPADDGAVVGRPMPLGVRALVAGSPLIGRRLGVVARRASVFGRIVGVSGSVRRDALPGAGPALDVVRLPEGVWPLPREAEDPLRAVVAADPGMAAIARMYGRHRRASTKEPVRRGLPSSARRGAATASGALTGPSAVARRLQPAEVRVRRNESHGAQASAPGPPPARSGSSAATPRRAGPARRPATTTTGGPATTARPVDRGAPTPDASGANAEVVRAANAYARADNASAKAAAFAAAMGIVAAAPDSGRGDSFRPPTAGSGGGAQTGDPAATDRRPDRDPVVARRPALWAAAAGRRGGFGDDAGGIDAAGGQGDDGIDVGGGNGTVVRRSDGPVPPSSAGGRRAPGGSLGGGVSAGPVDPPAGAPTVRRAPSRRGDGGGGGDGGVGFAEPRRASRAGDGKVPEMAWRATAGDPAVQTAHGSPDRPRSAPRDLAGAAAVAVASAPRLAPQLRRSVFRRSEFHRAATGPVWRGGLPAFHAASAARTPKFAPTSIDAARADARTHRVDAGPAGARRPPATTAIGATHRSPLAWPTRNVLSRTSASASVAAPPDDIRPGPLSDRRGRVALEHAGRVLRPGSIRRAMAAARSVDPARTPSSVRVAGGAPIPTAGAGRAGVDPTAMLSGEPRRGGGAAAGGHPVPAGGSVGSSTARAAGSAPGAVGSAARGAGGSGVGPAGSSTGRTGGSAPGASGSSTAAAAASAPGPAGSSTGRTGGSAPGASGSSTAARGRVRSGGVWGGDWWSQWAGERADSIRWWRRPCPWDVRVGHGPW